MRTRIGDRIRVRLLALAGVCLGASTTAADPASAVRIRRHLGRAYDPGNPGAAVIVVHRGRVVYRGAHGVADVRTRSRLRPDLAFRIGSVTKQFTAVAILLLAHEGKLSLSDSIGKHLPEVPETSPATIEHCLQHTSGIRSYTESAGWLPRVGRDTKVEELSRFIAGLPPQFAPGERWHYSNSGYYLLGRIVEVVSGRRYGEFLRLKIFEPLGMKATRYEAAAGPGTVPAQGYERGPKGWDPAASLGRHQAFSAGGLWSTVDDLARWHRAVSEGRLLPAELWKRAHSASRLNDGRRTPYGYGWRLGRIRGRRSVQHTGSINGFRSASVWLPDQEIYVAVLSNAAGSRRTPLSVCHTIAALIAGDRWTHKGFRIPAARLAEWEGAFAARDGRVFELRAADGRLFAGWRDGPLWECPAIAQDRFAVPDSFDVFTLVQARGGSPARLLLRGPVGGADLVRAPNGGRVDPKVARIAGRYGLTSRLYVDIAVRGIGLVATAPGQRTVRLVPAADGTWRVPILKARVRFLEDGAGRITHAEVRAHGQRLRLRRVR